MWLEWNLFDCLIFLYVLLNVLLRVDGVWKSLILRCSILILKVWWHLEYLGLDVFYLSLGFGVVYVKNIGFADIQFWYLGFGGTLNFNI